jgi:hypothetical protein
MEQNIIMINAATAIVSNNRLQCKGGVIKINVSQKSGDFWAATVVGNIVSGEIKVNFELLGPPWAVLNLAV